MKIVISPSKYGVVIAKGIAILAVITVHTLASLPSTIYTSELTVNLATAIDQFTRFSVPLFVALSGFALSKKYETTSVSAIPFYWSRLLKLLPLYVLWSAISIWVLSFSGGWSSGGPVHPIWLRLLRGEADYQFYFVPMILQLYAIFPLIRRVVSKYPLFSLVGAMSFQLLSYWVFRQQLTHQLELPFNASDQRHYLLCVTWIGYFVLGMVWAQWEAKKRLARWFPLWLLGAFGFYGVTTWSGITKINLGLDPILALRFTRPEVVGYAVSVILLILSIKEKFISFSKILTPIYWAGKHSYLLFLSHTLLLRIVAGSREGTVSIEVLVSALVVWGVGWMLSLAYRHSE